MDVFNLAFVTGWSTTVITSVAALVTLCLWRRYQYLLPINVPGPFAASFTRLWHMQRILKGDQNLELIRLHEKHGKKFCLLTSRLRSLVFRSLCPDLLRRS